MSQQNHAPSLRDSVYSGMKKKSTEELLGILSEGDREEWTDLAFEAIHEILAERLGDVSLQDAPATADPGNLAEDDRDTYHDPNVMVTVCSRARTLAWVILVASVVIWLVNVMGSLSAAAGSFAGLQLVSLLLPTAFTLVTGTFYFLVLLFLSEAGYVLLDIEENTYHHTQLANPIDED